MNTNDLHIDLINGRKKLQQVTASLKERFIGLDDAIDEVMPLLMPWYLFPDAQLRPTVINLWGLTGSGKTALIHGIVELLEYRRLYTHIDMGEFESDSSAWLKNVFTDDLDFFHEKPALICLDEFQFAKTLNPNGTEIGKDKLRIVWELLDTGKIEYIPGLSTYYLFRADNCLKRLNRLIKNEVILEHGEIVHGVETFMNIFDNFYFESVNRNGVALDKGYFLSEDFIEGLVSLLDNDDYSKRKVSECIKSSSLKELKSLLLEGMKSRPATRVLDLSRSLIFILGNLDEAYNMSKSVNPDISADEFHEATSKITLMHIKKALHKRFRPEQIARLGNNHVIYKSFNSEHFRMLIRRELNAVTTFVGEKFGWRLSFDMSVEDIIYAEGVYPTQGTRPVFTTVKNLVESRVSNLVVSILESESNVSEIVWRYAEEQFVYQAKDQSGVVVLTISDKVKLKLENMRRSVDPEIQASVAVHEAGHAVLALLAFRIIPSMVVSRTASDVEGFCVINFPKGPMTRESLKKDIVITLGGYVAEKMIFGEEFTTSGVYLDMEEASRLANMAVQKYAMGSDPIHASFESSGNEDAFLVSQKHNAEALSIIRECEAASFELLKRNKLLLLKIADYLTTNSRMDEAQIEDFARRYGNEKWISESGFIRKEDYYQFNMSIKDQLKKLENDSVDLLIGGAIEIHNGEAHILQS